jgi:CMP-N-acetylneuraminic acid synthetase
MFNPVVSSDDPEILALAQSHGFGVIERPSQLATDDASSAAVALHAVKGTDSVMLLQPTTPFRSMGTVDRALRAFKATGAPTVAVRDVPHAFAGQQHISGIEAPTGSCYVISHYSLEMENTFMPPNYQSVMDTSLGGLDIDTEDDWRHAEAIAQSRVDDLRRAMVVRAGWAA